MAWWSPQTTQTFNLLLPDGKHMVNGSFGELFNVIRKESLNSEFICIPSSLIGMSQLYTLKSLIFRSLVLYISVCHPTRAVCNCELKGCELEAHCVYENRVKISLGRGTEQPRTASKMGSKMHFILNLYRWISQRTVINCGPNWGCIFNDLR